MQLRQLTNLEIKKIEEEYKEIIKTIEILKGILVQKRNCGRLLKKS